MINVMVVINVIVNVNVNRLDVTWLSAPIRKLVGIVISDTLTNVDILTGDGKGLSIVIV